MHFRFSRSFNWRDQSTINLNDLDLVYRFHGGLGQATVQTLNLTEPVLPREHDNEDGLRILLSFEDMAAPFDLQVWTYMRAVDDDEDPSCTPISNKRWACLGSPEMQRSTPGGTQHEFALPLPPPGSGWDRVIYRLTACVTLHRSTRTTFTFSALSPVFEVREEVSQELFPSIVTLVPDSQPNSPVLSAGEESEEQWWDEDDVVIATPPSPVMDQKVKQLETRVRELERQLSGGSDIIVINRKRKCPDSPIDLGPAPRVEYFDRHPADVLRINMDPEFVRSGSMGEIVETAFKRAKGRALRTSAGHQSELFVAREWFLGKAIPYLNRALLGHQQSKRRRTEESTEAIIVEAIRIVTSSVRINE
jgi:hypothetical protein